jgi:hypothetical protein
MDRSSSAGSASFLAETKADREESWSWRRSVAAAKICGILVILVAIDIDIDVDVDVDIDVANANANATTDSILRPWIGSSSI